MIWELSLKVGEVPGDEEAFDAVGVADADLDVVFLAEAGIGVKEVAFPEDAFDGVERAAVMFAKNIVHSFDDGAVKLADE